MKQLLQNLKTGTIELAEVPVSHLKEGHILVEAKRSLISAGTERLPVEFGKANFLYKGWIEHRIDCLRDAKGPKKGIA